MAALRLFFDLSGRLAFALAVVARLLIGVLVLLVVSDVAVRNAGLRPLAWTVNTSEMLLLYITFLAMPWLVRRKGHVFVIFLRVILPAPARRVLARLVYLACLGLCLYLGAVALGSLQLAIARGTFQMRSFDIPFWVIFAPMVAGFFLSAVEWLRYLLGFDDFYDADPLEAGGA